ncbi:NTP transferase domain-containing protein [Daejeonella sp.]|jgi:molybdenum cofactor cytidylyltransferase|uniref:nucleotidyltransferase family protein n=1 Tax=Daejeonella sp. TaxID=2805397 RepID=UPI003783B698
MPIKDRFLKNIGIIILAAGKSARMGSAKQLLGFRGKSLLQHSIDAALGSLAQQVIVVLGSTKETIQQELDQSKIQLIENPLWESGMASSIHFGLKKLKNILPEADGVIFMVCDQPYVSTDLLNKIIDLHIETGKNIVASKYADTLGTPTFFHHSLFEELSGLEGDTGAKSLIKKYKKQSESVNFDLGSIDIDTRENYLNLLK